MVLDGDTGGHLTITFATVEKGGALHRFGSMYSKLYSDVVIRFNM